MAYILTFYIFLPSLNNNTIFIFSSYFIKHTLASFFKFLCIRATKSLHPWAYKQANFSQKSLSPRLLHRLQLLLSRLHFTTTCCPGPGFAVEDLFFAWRSHAKSTAAVPVPPCSCPPRGLQLFHGGVQTTAQERAH